MNVVITEEQSKVILVEGMSDILSTIYEKSTDFSANLYKRISKRLKFNLKILLTFGASVGGLIKSPYITGEPKRRFVDTNCGQYCTACPTVILACAPALFPSGSLYPNNIFS